MKPFRERNPVPIGVIGIVAILLLMLLSFNANALPFIGGGTTYHADFSDGSGLKSGDDVRIAGVKVGKVTGVALKGAMVRVALQINTSARIGDQTRADIKIKTLLGQKYIALSPAGVGKLHGDIPLHNAACSGSHT